jgi:hypothetical protein
MPKTKAADPTPAAQGATFTMTSTHGGRRYEETFTVGPKCELNTGRWICTTHPNSGAFPNQLMKDIHLERPGPHVLAWICLEHGTEVP